jgi:hypothetical protein
MGFFWPISCLIVNYMIRKKRPPEREYGAAMGVIWGSIRAYFGKKTEIKP